MASRDCNSLLFNRITNNNLRKKNVDNLRNSKQVVHKGDKGSFLNALL